MDALKAGATDFVAKERPDRLVPALLRAVRESEERAARRRAEEDLRRARGELPPPVREQPASDVGVRSRDPALPGGQRRRRRPLRLLARRVPGHAHHGHPSRDEVARAVAAVRTRSWPGSAVTRGPGGIRPKDGRVIDVEVVAHDIEFGGRRRAAGGGPRRHRAQAPRGPAPPVAEAGGGGPARRGRGPRLQQPPERDHGLQRAPPASAARRGRRTASGRSRSSAPPSGAPASPASSSPSAAGRCWSRRVLDLNAALEDVKSMLTRLIGEDIQHRDRPRPGARAGVGRPRPDGAGAREPRRQRPRRDAGGRRARPRDRERGPRRGLRRAPIPARARRATSAWP